MPNEHREEKSNADTSFFHPDLLEIPPDGSEPYLKGYRCKGCGQLDFPKLTLCGNCWGKNFDVVRLSRRGKLYSFSDIYVGQEGMKTPYSFGYIDLPENLRIFAQLEGQPNSFKCDEEVELTVGPVRDNLDGTPLVSYKFRRIPDERHSDAQK